MSGKEFVRKHSLLLYFLLTYIISWGGIILILGPAGFQIFSGEKILTEGFSKQVLFIWLVMLAGPTISSFLLTWSLDGKEGLKRLIASIGNVKVGIKWYAASLFLIPLVLLAILFLLSFNSPRFLPNFSIIFGVAIGFMSGFFEEIGWTGFALKKLQLKYIPLVSGISLGFIHTIWHLFADYLGSINFYNETYFLHFGLWIVGLVALRILIVWIYNSTKSLFLAQLTHASFTGSQIIFGPVVSGSETITYYSIFVFTLLIVSGAIVLKEKGMFMNKFVDKTSKDL
ncbi:MAG: hypothetical protein HPY60_00920 [Candidatus Methanofastidiosum sp.]|nr:hypothetical protein [Methanofastidiosum sp.]